MFEPGADNMVVNSLKLFGHYYAATELPQVIEYDPITLETIRKVRCKKYNVKYKKEKINCFCPRNFSVVRTHTNISKEKI